MTLGQAVAFFGVLIHWNSAADGYSAVKYFILSLIALSFVLNSFPRRGLLSVTSLVYWISLIAVSILAMSPVCFVGRHLSYFTGVLPIGLVIICYHFSIGDDWQKIRNALIAACVVASLISIAQSYRLYLPQGDYFSGRVYACMGNPVFLAGVMAMAIPLCLGTVYGPFAIPLLLTTILLTQSRIGLVAAAVGVLGYLFARGAIGWRLFLAISAACIIATLSAFSSLRDTARSDLGRYHMARVAIMALRDNPLGIGPERFGWAVNKYRDEQFNRDLSETWNNGYVHNSLLEAMLTGGPLFLAVHLALMAAVALFLYRHGSPALIGCACAVFAFGLAQPTPLVMKCSLASLLGATDPTDRPLDRAPFTFVAIACFLASLSVLTASKIEMNGFRFGLASLVIEGRNHHPGMGDR